MQSCNILSCSYYLANLFLVNIIVVTMVTAMSTPHKCKLGAYIWV